MISQRRKYNYNVNSSLNSSKSRPTSTYKCFGNENIDSIYQQAYQSQQSKRIIQLESANKKMLEETTRQFHKFQVDVLKVEGILRIKQEQVERLDKQNKELVQDKQALIEALKQKQAIIQQFQAKLIELLTQKQTRKQISSASQYTQTSLQSIFVSDETQTEEYDTGVDRNQNVHTVEQYGSLYIELETMTKKQEEARERANLLEQQIYKLKEEVYVANSELSLVKQQFSTFKLLQEIQMAKKL